MTELQNRLLRMRDEKYAEFQAKLTPGIPPEDFIGVRVPQLRQFAKEYSREAEHEEFMRELPHRYYDENMLHGLLIERIRDCEECIAAIDKFLPKLLKMSGADGEFNLGVKAAEGVQRTGNQQFAARWCCTETKCVSCPARQDIAGILKLLFEL